jgi:small-conductance mechanosensitive channel
MDYLNDISASLQASVLGFYDSVALPPMYKKYLVLLGGIVLIYLVFKIVVPIVLRRFEKLAKKTKNDFDEEVVTILFKVRWPACLALVLAIANNYADWNEKISWTVGVFLVIFVSYWVIKMFTMMVEYGFRKASERKGPDSNALIPIFAKITNVFVWCIGILFVISNLGYEITPLITGLGIGGIAIALAVQNILGDLLSSVTIYMDKPFKVGDYIVIGKMEGTVKSVGLKTTRISALSGEELVMPNKKIVESTIQNYRRMRKRRVSFDVGVTYETKKAKLEKVPVLIEKVIKGVRGAELGRIHFKKMDDFSLNFEVVYYVPTNDYVKYLDMQQKINYGLFEAFSKEKIEFAYPTQKVFVSR